MSKNIHIHVGNTKDASSPASLKLDKILGDAEDAASGFFREQSALSSEKGMQKARSVQSFIRQARSAMK